GAGVNTFNNVAGSSFTNVNANAAIKDNIINNPSFAAVKGNDGWTANGDANNLGPVQNLFGAAGAGVFRRSGDVVFADNHHQIHGQVPAAIAPVHFVQPQFATPVFAQPQFVAGTVIKRSGDVVFADNHHQIDNVVSPVALAGQVVPVIQHPHAVALQPIVHHAVAPVFAEQNGQKATIVQNQV
ncbi:hypothetical protein LPJ75_000980, partial [Coemansia sp. RSA 2598]